MIHPAVPLLEAQPALHRLEVVQDGLGLHRAAPPPPGYDRVPRSEIAFDREGYLGAPAQGRFESDAETFEETLLPRVADRVAGRVQVQSQILAGRGGNGREGRQIDGRSTVGFESIDRRFRDARRRSDCTKAESACATTGGDVLENAPEVRVDPSDRSIDRSRTTRHRADHRYTRSSGGWARLHRQLSRRAGRTAAGPRESAMTRGEMAPSAGTGPAPRDTRRSAGRPPVGCPSGRDMPGARGRGRRRGHGAAR